MNKHAFTLLLFFTAMLMAALAHARPYTGDIFTFTQPNGAPFQVRLYGDEYYANIETLDGYTLTKDPVTGFYCYAALAADSMSFVSTGYKPADPLPPGHGLTKHIRLAPRARKQKSQAMRRKFGVNERGRLLPSLRLQMRPRDMGYDQWNQPLAALAMQLESEPGAILPAPPIMATTGTRVGLVLLARFPDRMDDATITQSQVDAYANDPDYADFSNATSVYGYYNIQSSGHLQYNCIVTAYFTAAHPRSYYTDNAIAFGTRAKELINEGLEVLKADGFDFTKTDANNDNVVDGINLFYAGTRINNWSEGLWPHKWNSSWSGLADAGLNTSFQYQITDMGTSLSLGTFCHENGHMLCDFPDLYSYDGNAAEINSYSLMSNSGTTHPVSVDAYLKIHAGWATVKDIAAADHTRGALLVDQNTFYRFKNPARSTEYFLLSLRTDAGYEGVYGGSASSANPTNGIVIWHALENGSNTYSSIFTGDNPWADYSLPYELMVVEANPLSVTTPWYDAPNPGTNDGYYSGDVSEASDATTPALKFWDPAATGRTVLSNMHVHSVSARGDTMTFIAGTGALVSAPEIGLTTSTLSPVCDSGTDASSGSFAVFNAGSGTLNYTMSEDLSWLDLDINSGAATTEADLVTVSYDTDTLVSGTHEGTITITDSAAVNSPQTISVALTVNDPPVIAVDTNELETSVTAGEEETASFTIANSGGGTLSYTLAESADWLELGKTSGTVAAEEDILQVTFDASDMFEGTYTTDITVSDTGGQSPDQTISVTLHVSGNIIVSSPAGGETLWQGNRHAITWKTNDRVTGNLTIELYKNGSPAAVISSDHANNGICEWTIAGSQTIGTDYRVHITSDDDTSIAGESLSDFSISALPAAISIPYNESFEADIGEWTQSTDDDFDWTRDAGGTPSASTGPSAAQNGSFYIYTESSSPNYPDKRASVENVFDLRTATAPMLSFYYHMYGATLGTLSITATTDQSRWTSLFSKTGNQGNSWYNATCDLSRFAGQVVKISITGTTGSSYYSDMAIDMLSITEASRTVTGNSDIFTENSSNDGSISNSITFTLTGDTFTADAVSGGHVNATGVPSGLSASFVRDSATRIILSLAGNAGNHANADSVTDLEVNFDNNAFTGGDASSVAGNSQTLMVDYFDILQLLSVTRSGIGTGTITSSPAGIDCGADCSYRFSEGRVVTLSATPADAFSWLEGWSGGGCSGTGDCTVTMNSDTTVTAVFDATDSDNDGTPDHLDAFPENPAYDDDSDNDGLPTDWENLYGLNPATDDAAGDPDNDGFSNLEEFIAGTDPQSVTIGPGIATLVSPDDGTINQPLSLELETGYTAGASEAAHLETIWQVAEDPAFSTIVFTLTSTTYKTALTVPHSLLDPVTTYYWRARYVDTDNADWPWAASRTFTTAASTEADDNFNGPPDSMEVSSGTSMDLDQNTQDDLIQNGMHCLSLPGDAGDVCLKEGNHVAAMDTFRWMTTDDVETAGGLPEWILGFRLQTDTPGASATVTIYFSEPLEAATVWYKYDTINGWYDYSAHAVISDDRKSVTIELKDGGFGDADGIANSIITDPSGPLTISSTSDNTDTNTIAVPAADSSGGCFITISKGKPD
ncbi:MAG: M6 family metalloprotease domain-containing protein [Thermodesulfobacteriota bacterium]|nr:M6 family metalloprotease domain-containing protein [Thermodesulfobacteriota bacterium]